jgi:phosphoribosylanthranilate isomerase
MSLWVKICANTSVEDALLAANAGADALGFVFAPSPRRVTVDQVAAITPHLPPAIERIGVFVDTGFQDVVAAIRTARLTGVQLHSGSEPGLTAGLRAEFGPSLRILRVAHFGPEAAAQAAEYAGDPAVDAVLIDSRTATAIGGTGIVFDWDEAARTLFGPNFTARMIAAGGLGPANVAEAIARLQPWGVDVASGVEASPGRKDPAKVRAFVENARAAAAHPSKNQLSS